MPVTINGTTGVVFPDGVTQGSGVPTASGTSGAPLVSNGTIYTQNTAVGIAFGGTGATSAATARSNLGTNDAANITTGTLASARLPTTGVNAASITTGTLAVANGGTGTATPSLVAGTNITISGAWPNQTVTAAGGGVTSLNGQTGAITNTTLDAIGCYVCALVAVTAPFPNQLNNQYAVTKYQVNTTVSGSSLRYGFERSWVSSLQQAACINEGPQRTVGGQTSVGYASGGTSLSGTYRCISACNIFAAWECGNTTATWQLGLWVRIS